MNRSSLRSMREKPASIWASRGCSLAAVPSLDSAWPTASRPSCSWPSSPR
jgi:hypothetical protein